MLFQTCMAFFDNFCIMQHFVWIRCIKTRSFNQITQLNSINSESFIIHSQISMTYTFGTTLLKSESTKWKETSTKCWLVSKRLMQSLDIHFWYFSKRISITIVCNRFVFAIDLCLQENTADHQTSRLYMVVRLKGLKCSVLWKSGTG